jgi:acyl dehydratase
MTTEPAAGAPTDHAEWFSGYVDADWVLAFANATNDPSPLYASGERVPPLFSVALVLKAFQAANLAATTDAEITGTRAGVHGSHEVTFIGPLQVGMPITWCATPYRVRNGKAGAFVDTKVTIADEDRAPLVEHLWTSLLVGGVAAHEYGPVEGRVYALPDEVRARPLGSRAIEVARDQSFRYAGVSANHNPHTSSDIAAQREGFPRKIMQGLGSLSMVSGALVALTCGGEPNRLRSMAARLASPLHPGSTLLVETFDAGVDEGGRQVVAFEATSGDATVIKFGRAVADPA